MTFFTKYITVKHNYKYNVLYTFTWTFHMLKYIKHNAIHIHWNNEQYWFHAVITNFIKKTTQGIQNVNIGTFLNVFYNV